jgi:hypothetical protein
MSDLTTVLLVLVGILSLYAVYQEVRIGLMRRPTFVVMPQQQSEESAAGCSVVALLFLIVLVLLLRAMDVPLSLAAK